MSCCGKKRAGASQAAKTRPKLDGPVYFQYVGRTGLTVIGVRTRKQYRFARSGAVVATDPRDWRALVDVPTLRPVEAPQVVSQE